MDCPAALERIREDRPITIKDDKGNNGKLIAEIVANFITTMDKLRMDIRSMDELLPDCKDLVDNLNTLSILPSDFEGRIKVEKWLTILKDMSVSDELSDEQVREMLFDYDAAHADLHKILHKS